MGTLNLENLDVCCRAMAIGETVWNLVETWDYFSKDTIGKQWLKSSDSIAANIAEGYGRFCYKENKLFCYYSRGSLMESRTWLVKAYNRKLIDRMNFDHLYQELEIIRKMLNNYINSIGK